jgi:hypothetical protein
VRLMEHPHGVTAHHPAPIAGHAHHS